ncbi:MAG: DUF2461 domain-containing protein [Nocardioides sp.]
MSFAGFPVAALDFYEDLEVDNSKTFWTAHKDTYDTCVKTPMDALCAELAEEFGAAKMFRPYRDVRFSKDKTPYKTHQGAYIPTGAATGWYVQLSARGVMTGGGFYDADSARLGRVRDAIDADASGAALARIVATLTDAGWELGGDTLKTAPRGFDTDHPRIGLLRHKSVIFTRQHGFEPVIHTPDLVGVVRADWSELRPFIEWVATYGD